MNSNKPEIILNLWYVVDDMGVFYSLRGRTYIGTGTDQEKLAFLQQFSKIDYLIAKPFPIPKKFHYKGMSIYLKAAYDLLPQKITLFEDLIQYLQNDLPSQTPLDIPKQPLVCITPLLGDDQNRIVPFFDGYEKL